MGAAEGNHYHRLRYSTITAGAFVTRQNYEHERRYLSQNGTTVTHTDLPWL
jgi:hypothetical protein